MRRGIYKALIAVHQFTPTLRVTVQAPVDEFLVDVRLRRLDHRATGYLNNTGTRHQHAIFAL